MARNKKCSHTKFPLVVSDVVTGVTLSKVTCDISGREFTTGLSYVAVSRVSKLECLMFDVPFEQGQIYREPLIKAIQAKMTDYQRRMEESLQ